MPRVGERKSSRGTTSLWLAPWAGLAACAIPLACSILLLGATFELAQGYRPAFLDVPLTPQQIKQQQHYRKPDFNSPVKRPPFFQFGHKKRIAVARNNVDSSLNPPSLVHVQLAARLGITREECLNYQVNNLERKGSLEAASRLTFIETLVCLKLMLWRVLFILPDSMVPKQCCELDIYRFFKICKKPQPKPTTPKPSPTTNRPRSTSKPTSGPAPPKPTSKPTPKPKPKPTPTTTTSKPSTTRRPPGSSTTPAADKSTTTKAPSPKPNGGRSGLDEDAIKLPNDENDAAAAAASTEPAPAPATTAEPKLEETTTTPATPTTEDNQTTESAATTAEPKKKHHKSPAGGHKKD